MYDETALTNFRDINPNKLSRQSSQKFAKLLLIEPTKHETKLSV